jgi:PAS domain S-box-containing protein
VSNHTPYREALDAISQFVWLAGPDGAVEYLNRWGAEYAGLPLDDMLGWDWSWLVHPADLVGTLNAWSEAVRDGTRHEVEQRLRRRDGEYRWFLVRGEPVRDGDGRVVRWVGTCTDIDESKRGADQLREMRTMLRALVERNTEGMALVGADGTVRYANPAAARLLSSSPEDLAGTDLWGLVAAEDRGLFGRWWERVLASPGERSPIQLRFMTGGAALALRVGATNLLPDPEVRAVTVQLRAAAGADQ